MTRLVLLALACGTDAPPPPETWSGPFTGSHLVASPDPCAAGRFDFDGRIDLAITGSLTAALDGGSASGSGNINITAIPSLQPSGTCELVGFTNCGGVSVDVSTGTLRITDAVGTTPNVDPTGEIVNGTEVYPHDPTLTCTVTASTDTAITADCDDGDRLFGSLMLQRP